MDRTRIRWASLGRVFAGLGAGGLLIAVLPGLLESPDPPRLPADVGLDSGASGVYAQVGSRPDEPVSPPHRPSHHRPTPDPDPDPDRGHRAPDPPPRPRSHRPEAPAEPVSAPPVDPAPPPPSPPVQPPPPLPADTGTGSDGGGSEQQPDPQPTHSPSTPPQPSQFGFEH